MAAKNAFQPGTVGDGEAREASAALRALVKLDKASDALDRKHGEAEDSLIGGVCHAAAVYITGELRRFPSLAGDVRLAFLKAARRLFNATVTAKLGKDAPLVKRDRFAKVHAMLEHKATARYAAAALRGDYGAVIPPEEGGDGKARYTLKAASDIITEANKAAKVKDSPEAAFTKMLNKLADGASDRAAFLQMAAGIVARMLSTPTPAAPAPATPTPAAPAPAARKRAKAAK
jgi:hypothetical protein